MFVNTSILQTLLSKISLDFDPDFLLCIYNTKELGLIENTVISAHIYNVSYISFKLNWYTYIPLGDVVWKNLYKYPYHKYNETWANRKISYIVTHTFHWVTWSGKPFINTLTSSR